MAGRIREAGVDELELLIKWRMEVLCEVFSIPADQRTAELEEENRRYYQEALPAGAHIACFAWEGDDIVGCGGMCLYREMPSPDNPTGKCAYLMNLYVRPGFRGKGMGKLIAGWLVKQAEKQGISKIYLETSEAGRPLYQEMGFSDMADMMKLTEKQQRKKRSEREWN